MGKKSKLLEEIGKQIKEMSLNIDVTEIPLTFLEELTVDIKYGIVDYRADISYHPIENIIMLTFIGLLGNCNEWHEIYEFSIIHKEWYKKFLNLEYGIPSETTIRRVMSVVEPEELERICVKIIIRKIEEYEKLFKDNLEKNKGNKSEKDVISYDGKKCCSSGRKKTVKGEIKPVNAMTAFNVTKDISLATKFIEEKTNEIPTGPELIKMLDLTNTISCFDALNTQVKTIKAIADKGGDYVAALKGNQHNIYEDILDYFNDEELYKKAYEKCHYEEKEYAHGNEEKRVYVMTDDIKWLEHKKWEKMKTIGICIREYYINKEKRREIRYYISSLGTEDIRDFSRGIREEWGIENNLHWHLDVTFKEDKNRTMDKKAQANLNILRKLSLNILKLIKPLYNKSLKLIRFRIGQNFEMEIQFILMHLNIELLKNMVN